MQLRKLSSQEKIAWLRLIVAPKALAGGNVEYKVRGTDEKGLIPLDRVVDFVQNWISQEMKKYQ